MTEGRDIETQPRVRVVPFRGIAVRVERGARRLADYGEIAVLHQRRRRLDAGAEGLATRQKVKLFPWRRGLAPDELVNDRRYEAAIAAEVVAKVDDETPRFQLFDFGERFREARDEPVLVDGV